MAWTDKYVSVSGSGAHDGSSTANEWTLAEAIAAYAAGQKLNVKAGTYSSGATDRTFGTAGSTTAPILWNGYNSTPGDLDTEITSQRTPGTDMPLFTSTTGRYFFSTAFNWVENIAFTSGYTASATVMARGGNHNFTRCRMENSASSTSSSAFDVATSNFVSVQSCHLRRTATTSGYKVISQGATYLRISNSIIEGGDIGLLQSGNVLTQLDNVIFRGQATNSITMTTGYLFLTDATLYNIGGDAIAITGAPGVCDLRRVYFHTIGGYCINNSSGTNTAIPRISRCCYYNVTSGQTAGITNDEQQFPLTDASDKFVNAAGNDFTLVSSSSGYSYPILFEKDGPTAYRDSGAVGHDDVAGGGGGGALILGGLGHTGIGIF